MISEALDEDADSNFSEAYNLYTSAVEFYLTIVSLFYLKTTIKLNIYL
jgi:hypothetical protein